MNVTISVRHGEIPTELRERAELVAHRLASRSPHVLEGTVVFDTGREAHRTTPTVEIRLHLRGGKVVIGLGDGPDHRTALDNAEDKVRSQIDKQTPRSGRRGAAASEP